MFPFNLINKISVKTGDVIIDEIYGHSIHMLMKTHNIRTTSIYVNGHIIIPIYWNYYLTAQILPVKKIKNVYNKNFTVDIEFYKLSKYYPLQITMQLVSNTIYLSQIERNNISIVGQEYMLRSIVEDIYPFNNINSESTTIDFNKYGEHKTRMIKSINFSIEDKNGNYVDQLNNAELIINNKLYTNLTPIVSYLNYKSTTNITQPNIPIYYIPFSLNDKLQELQTYGSMNLYDSQLVINSNISKGKIRLWFSYHSILLLTDDISFSDIVTYVAPVPVVPFNWDHVMPVEYADDIESDNDDEPE